MNLELASDLDSFVEESTFSVREKGALSSLLQLTRILSKKEFPFNIEDFLTPQGGQVAGLSGRRLAKILKEHGELRVLSKEGGRTSRGAIAIATAYFEFLNSRGKEVLKELESIEKYWIRLIEEYFDSQPLVIKKDKALSMRATFQALLHVARERQKERRGFQIVGALLQHLVGAKLELLLDCEIDHNGASVSDAQRGRQGDFEIEDVVIHVTTAPNQSLVEKCIQNLEASLRPIIITLGNGMNSARLFADEHGVADRIDVFDAEQFLASNLYELGRFTMKGREQTVEGIIRNYNRIVVQCENDPSLLIEIS